jgi:hypothetical protein
MTIEHSYTDEIWNKPAVFKPLTSSEDILALSVTWHRLRTSDNPQKASGDMPSDLLDKILRENLTSEDKAKANMIREHFSKKIMMQLLLDAVPMSNFRKDLNSFIHSSPGTPISDKLSPLIYRLPELYEYDLNFQAMFVNEQLTKTIMPCIGRYSVNLIPLTKMSVVLKTKGKFIEYWLKDDANKAYKIEILNSNGLHHLWDHFYDKKEVIPMIGSLQTRHRDGIDYFKLNNWEIDFSKI